MKTWIGSFNIWFYIVYSVLSGKSKGIPFFFILKE